jgi:hypothetical protein
MNVKNLGTSFATRYLMTRLSGGDQRTAFRRAGVGSLTENANLDPEIEDFAIAVADDLAVARAEESYLDIASTEGVTTTRPTQAAVDAARSQVESVISTATESALEQAEQELAVFESEIADARVNLRRRMRLKNLDK